MALPGSAVQLRRILAHFPQELSLAFAYGSGVFRQAGAAAGLSAVSGFRAPRAAPAARLGLTGAAAVPEAGRRRVSRQEPGEGDQGRRGPGAATPETGAR